MELSEQRGALLHGEARIRKDGTVRLEIARKLLYGCARRLGCGNELVKIGVDARGFFTEKHHRAPQRVHRRDAVTTGGFAELNRLERGLLQHVAGEAEARIHIG